MALRFTVTGLHGQVVTALRVAAGARGVEVLALGRPALDMGDPASVEAALTAARGDVIINAAAYTAVDKAESEPDRAFAINAVGAEAAARAAARLRVPLVQISTDYVFAGDSPRPYCEDDPVGPTGVYGRSKLEGECRVAAAWSRHAILRTSWVHAPWGANFVRTMLRLAHTRDEISVVADQQGAPTSAVDLADGIVTVAKSLIAHPNDASLTGTFHMASAGETTWAGFAEAVFAASRARRGPSAVVKHITTADYPTPARRPANSRLDSALLAERHGVRLPHWEQSVGRSVEGLLTILAAEQTSA